MFVSRRVGGVLQWAPAIRHNTVQLKQNGAALWLFHCIINTCSNTLYVHHCMHQHLNKHKTMRPSNREHYTTSYLQIPLRPCGRHISQHLLLLHSIP